MSVQSLASASNTRITPASASFEAAAAATGKNLLSVCSIAKAFDMLSAKARSASPQPPTPGDKDFSLLSNLLDYTSNKGVASETRGWVVLDACRDGHGGQGDKNVPQPQLKHLAAEDIEEAAVAEQSGAGAAEASNTSAKEAEYARSNWLELHVRVQNINPRVFAFQEDPKYLQQCENAKQRRTLAAATSISPSWH